MGAGLSRSFHRLARLLGIGRSSRFVPWAARILGMDRWSIEVWQRLIITSFLVTLAVYGARSAHFLDGAETWWLDRMANADRVEIKAPITVVSITDRDYYDPDLFNGTSPLDPGALNRILERVIAHEPRGVLLDIQIHPALRESDERKQGRLQLYETLRRVAEEGHPPVILVRDFQSELRERPRDAAVWAAWRELSQERRLFWADPFIKRNGGYVRSVPRIYTGEDAGELGLPTVLGAAIEAFDLTPHRSVPFWVQHERDDPGVPWRIRFSGRFLEDEPGLSPYHITAGTLLDAPPVEGARSLLHDRLVLIGGTYAAGRDIQPTVVGDMAGIHVWAEAIASWIRHDALREPAEPLTFAVEFLLGVVAGLLLSRWGPAFGLIAQVLAIGPLMILFSLLTFGDRVLFVNFIPTLAGVYLHYQVELHLKIRELERQLADAKKPRQSEFQGAS